MTAAAFIAAARSRLGCRWKHQARGPVFFDCSGLAAESLRDAGHEPAQDRTDYGRIAYAKRLRAGLIAEFGEPLPPGDLRPGDIVTLRWVGEENHVAIVTDHAERGLGLIHCYAVAPGGRRGGRVVEHGMDDAWRARIVEAWRPFADEVSP